jgi:uncharacterized protein
MRHCAEIGAANYALADAPASPQPLQIGMTIMRNALMDALKQAMKAGDRLKVDTIRMVQSALKNRDIEARGEGKTLSPADELALLQKLVKSRQESVDLFEKGGRKDLADKERAEIAIIQSFLPQQMSEQATAAAIAEAIAEVGAVNIKDMGKVIAALKAKFAGQMDFAKASQAVKAALGN